MDVSKITERLYCGAQISSEGGVQQLIMLGITHVIDAQAERDDAALLADRVSYLFDPERDDGVHPKPAAWFGRAVEFAMDAFSHRGAVVMTHCAGGINRGPSLAYAILRAQGYAADEALSLLKSRRPVVQVAYREDAELALRQLGWVK